MGNIDDLYDRDKKTLLGTGTYATVYSAVCKRTGERVALKKLRNVSTTTAAAAPAMGGARDGIMATPMMKTPFGCYNPGGGGGGGAGGGGIAGKPLMPAGAAGAVAAGGAAGSAGGGGGGGCGADDRGGVSQAALREIKVLRELRHPHIIRLRETLHHKKTLVLAFDYAAGGDLELLLYGSSNGSGGGGGGASSGSGSGGVPGAPPPLDPAVVKAHLKALLEALAYCHEQGVLHRDVKPNNLLLDGAGRLLLADFG
ncbi:hypothetical protein Agub_g14047, partial [Astrephomene gubernaculifera]